MARRRRRADRADSLELLLDTICNVFGGIIFIAILVAILTSDRSERVAEDARGRLESAEQQRRAMTLEERIAELVPAIERMERTAAAIGTDEGERRADVLEQIEREREEAEQRHDDARQWLDQYDQALVAQADDLETELQAEQQRLTDLEAELETIAQQQTLEARLPYERRTARRQVLLVVHRERLFIVPLGFVEQSLRNAGLDHHVQVRSVLGSSRVTPRTRRGVELEDGFVEHDDVERLLDLLGPQRHFFDICVTPDSYGAFQTLRRELVKRGYRYNVRPYEGRGGRITFTPTASPLPVQ